MVLPYSPPATLSRLIRDIDQSLLQDTDRVAEWNELMALRLALHRLNDPFTPWTKVWDVIPGAASTRAPRRVGAILDRARYLVEHPSELATELRFRMGSLRLRAFANFAASNLSQE